MKGALLALTFAATYALAGCSGKANTSASDTAATTDSAAIATETATKPVTERFALSFFQENGVSLMGDHAQNLVVTLIDFTKKQAYSLATTHSFTYEDEGLGSLTLTGLSGDAKFDTYGIDGAIALCYTPDDLAIITPSAVTDRDIHKKLSAICKKSKMEQLFEGFDSIDPQVFEVIKAVDEINAGGIRFYVASFGKANSDEVGPRFIVLPNGKSAVLSGPCSFDSYGAYSANGFIYLHSHSSCCDCGQNVYNVHRISANSIESIYGNADLSM